MSLVFGYDAKGSVTFTIVLACVCACDHQRVNMTSQEEVVESMSWLVGRCPMMFRCALLFVVHINLSKYLPVHVNNLL